MGRSGIEFSITIKDEGLKTLLVAMEARGKDLSPFFKKSALIMTRSFAKNFEQEGRPSKWKPLSKNTVAGRRKGSKKILQDRGMLRLSAISRGASGNITKFTKDSLKMGSRQKTAVWNQEGTKPYTIVPKSRKTLSFMTASGRVFVNKVNHPGLIARPFIVIQTEDEDAMATLALDHMTKGIN